MADKQNKSMKKMNGALQPYSKPATVLPRIKLKRKNHSTRGSVFSKIGFQSELVFPYCNRFALEDFFVNTSPKIKLYLK